MPVFFKAPFNGYSVKFSPFYESRLAVATSQNFGILCNGRLHVIDLSPAPTPLGPGAPRQPITELVSYDTANGVYDVAWFESHDSLLVAAIADGSVKIYDTAMVPYSPEIRQPVVYSLHHDLNPPITRLSISWSRCNTLRVSVLRPPSGEDSEKDEVGGKVVEVRLSNGDGENGDAKWRRIAYGSVLPFALLQSWRSSVASLSKVSMGPSLYNIDWWEYVMEYSKDINSLLGSSKSLPDPVIEDSKMVLRKVEEPTALKAAWGLMEIFYANKQFQPKKAPEVDSASLSAPISNMLQKPVTSTPYDFTTKGCLVARSQTTPKQKPKSRSE